MATTLHGKVSKTFPKATPAGTNYRDLLASATFVSTTLQILSSGTTETNGEKQFGISGLPITFWSERRTAEVTIAGSIQFAISVYQNSATLTATGRIRTRLSKVTAGGSDVETLIVMADAASDLVSGTAVQSFVIDITPSVPVTLAPDERFVWRIYLVPHVTTGYGDVGSLALVRFNGAINTDRSRIIFTETFTTVLNTNQLYTRQTAVNAIGTFYDLIPERNTGATATGVVNTTSGGTGIQWTRTAGGTVLEWVSGRSQEPWLFDAIGVLFAWRFHFHESNAAANCAYRIKLFHRTPAGVETLVFTYSHPSEMSTSITAQNTQTGTLDQSIEFREDDRLVLRVYITNVGTMAAGHTCTLTYDSAVASGDSFITLLQARFKSETDPARSEAVPDGMSMGGIGN